MIKGYKYRILPNKEQQYALNQMFGNARFVYNWALKTKIDAYQNEKINLSAFSIMKELTKLKKQEDFNWLKLSVAQSLQQSIANMDNAFKMFFKYKKNFPKFKTKNSTKQSVSFPQNVRIDFLNKKVSVNKIGWIRTKISREFDGKIKIATIERKASGKYYISTRVEIEAENVQVKPIKSETSVGIDTGIKTFAVMSDGSKIENKKHLNNSLTKLKVLSRRVSKKRKGGKNRKKAVQKLRVLYEKISNQRLDFLHKTTTAIAKQYDTVIVEDLNIAGMVKNRCLSKSISDLGLGIFYFLLKYKIEESGGNYIKIGRFEPSSKLCTCGEINKDLKLSDRTWTCESCGATHDRDLLAANNIKNIGLKNSRQGLSGEPAELPTIVGAMKQERLN